MSLKIAYLNLNWNLPGANELNHYGLVMPYGAINHGFMLDSTKLVPEPMLT